MNEHTFVSFSENKEISTYPTALYYWQYLAAIQ